MAEDICELTWRQVGVLVIAVLVLTIAGAGYIELVRIEALTFSINEAILNGWVELGGILLTVPVIDRLLQRREKKRWKPAKQFLYSDLFRITEKLLSSLTPPRLRLIATALP